MLSGIERLNGNLPQGKTDIRTQDPNRLKKEPSLLLVPGDHYFRGGTKTINPEVTRKQIQILRGQY